MNLIRIGSLDNRASLINANDIASQLLSRGWNTKIDSTNKEIEKLLADLKNGDYDLVAIDTSLLPTAIKGIEPLGLLKVIQDENVANSNLVCVLCSNLLRESSKQSLREIFKNEELENQFDSF